MTPHDDFAQEYDLVFVPEAPESLYRIGYHDAMMSLGDRSYMLMGTDGYEEYRRGRIDGIRAKENETP